MSETVQCPFCALLAKRKDDIEYRKTHGRGALHADEYVDVFMVSLVESTYYVGREEPELTGRMIHRAFELNNCPVCGVKIKKEK